MTEQHPDTVAYTRPTNGEIHANLISDVDQDQFAPTHCPVCLSRIVTPRNKRLADGSMRRYRRCPEGCYEDTVALVVVKAKLYAPD